MKTTHICLIILACCALWAAAGCRAKTAGESIITASSGGRDVQVSADGPAWVHAHEDHITVKLPGHEIVIEKERLLVDNATRAKLPAGAKKFEVSIAVETLTVNADAAEILKTPLK